MVNKNIFCNFVPQNKSITTTFKNRYNMPKVITLAGSNSKNSINKEFAEYAGSLLHGKDLKNLDLNDYDLPMFSIDREEAHGFPEDLSKLEDEIAGADGIILSLAEHNGAYSAAFKNAFDWLSRKHSKLWRNIPMLLLSTSPGGRGGVSVMAIAMDRFPRHDANIIASMSLPFFDKNFKDGKLIEEELSASLREKIELFEKAI
jgi:NAD(P)H-dependent FMN reductase